MNEVTKLFMGLCNTQGTNAKQDFVKKYKDNLEFIKSLKFLLRTDNPTGISSKKYDKWEEVSMFDDENVPNLKATLNDLFNYLEINNTGRDTDIRWVHSFVDSWSECNEDKEFLRKIICKDYPIGIDIKGVNKVFPNLIPTFDVMLADKFLDLDEKALNRISNNRTREFVLQEKLDGVRCVAIKDNGNVKFVSRQGKAFENLIMLEKVLQNIPIDNFVLDGELIITDRKSIPSGEQYKATIKKVTVKDKEIDGVTLNVFDYLPLSEWNGKNCTLPYSERYDILMSMFNKLELEPYFHLVENIYIGNDLERVLIELTKARNNNWEGIMLRWLDSKYEFKRSKELLKVKAMETYDLTIIDTFEGENSLVGKLGGFIAEITLPDGKFVHTKIGSGFSLEDREEFWSKRSELIGKNVEIQGFELTTNDNSDSYSIRFPVFKGFIDEGKELNGDYKGV